MIILAACFAMLGYWQHQRLTWKNNIIANLQMDYAFGPEKIDLDHLENLPRYGQVSGTYSNKDSFLLSPRIVDEKPAYALVTPMRVGAHKIMVERDTILLDGAQEILHALRERPNDDETITGLLKPAQEAPFFAPPQDKRNHIYNNTLFVRDALPVIMHVQESAWFPRNHHAQYRAFWFLMCILTLILTILSIRYGPKLKGM